MWKCDWSWAVPTTRAVSNVDALYNLGAIYGNLGQGRKAPAESDYVGKGYCRSC
jgi:hypothetical protein